jgi:hypothetical protein
VNLTVFGTINDDRRVWDVRTSLSARFWRRGIPETRGFVVIGLKDPEPVAAHPNCGGLGCVESGTRCSAAYQTSRHEIARN